MQKFLIAVGCQPSKLSYLSKGEKRKLIDYLNTAKAKYDAVISVIRVNDIDSRNFTSKGDNIGDVSLNLLEYESDDVMEVSGYDLDCKLFRKDAEYDIIGLSTGASVLCIAMSMYSRGLKIRVLKDYCYDRKGLQKQALQIMDSYMEGVVV